MKIPTSVRRDIFDAIILSNFHWSGHLEEPEFLSRIFDLSKLPSFDNRFENAAGDIWQHRINNYDWDDDWIFTDERFDLLHCDDEYFLRFLCETIHPVVRPNQQEVQKLLQYYNPEIYEQRVVGFFDDHLLNNTQ